MSTTLVVSSVLLATLLSVRHIELAQKKQLFSLSRLKLDRFTTKVLRGIVRACKRIIEYIHKDIFLNILHMLTYSALVMVRFVEKGLHNGTLFLRSFKKKKHKETIADNLQSIMKEGNTQEEDEHNT